MTEAAHAAARAKATCLPAQFWRLAARRGKTKAIIAVEHSILVTAHRLLAAGVRYAELGGTYFDEREPRVTERRLVRRLEGLGYRVALEPAVRGTAAG